MAVVGPERVIGKLNRLPAALQKPISNALQASAAEMLGHAVKTIQKGGGGGRTYIRRGRSHTASAPGAYPHSDSGALVGSGRWEVRSAFNVIWGFFVKHAKWLELGTSRMRARPSIRPTFNLLHERAVRRVRDAINAAVRAYGR